MKRPLSICIITYNEEAKIRRCLESVKWAEEIIVVDSHSTDKTVEICREYTEKVLLRKFEGHIEQKNFAIDQAAHRWILSLDGDEEASPELQREVQEILSRENLIEVGFDIPRKNDYLGEWATYGGFYPDLKLRLFHRDHGRWGGINPHDHIVLSGSKGRLQGEILHYTYESLSHHAQVINYFTTIGAEQKFKKGTSLPIWRAFFHGLGRFLDAYFIKGAIFHGPRGFILSVMHGYYGFLKYAKVWELQERENGKINYEL